MKTKEIKAIVKKLQAVKNNDKGTPVYDYMQIDGNKYTLTSVIQQLTINGEPVSELNEIIKVDFELFYKIINKTTCTDIVLSYESDTLVINGKHKIPAINEYIPTINVNNVQLNKTQLTEQMKKATIKAVNFVSDNSIRPLLCGIFFNGKDIVSTDAYYLYRMTNIGCEFADYLNYIMPVSIVNFIEKANTIELRKDNYIVLEGSDFQYVCKNIEGKYPNYNAVIPKTHEHTTTINKKELMNELAESKISGNGIANTYEMFDSGIKIESKNEYFNTSFNSSIGLLDGSENMVVSFKNCILETILKNYEPEQLNILYNDKTRPALFTDNDETFLLMPYIVDK